MPRTFKVTDKETKYENPWLVLKEYTIERDGTPAIYGVIERNNAITIVASTDDHRILFEKQFRFPTESHSWELPMGAVDPGEDPSQAASRELLEETGLVIPLTKIGSFRPVPGLTPQTATVFTGSIPDDIIAALEAFDEEVDEILERRLLSASEIKAMIASGDISDGFTLSSLALLKFQ